MSQSKAASFAGRKKTTVYGLIKLVETRFNIDDIQRRDNSDRYVMARSCLIVLLHRYGLIYSDIAMIIGRHRSCIGRYIEMARVQKIQNAHYEWAFNYKL